MKRCIIIGAAPISINMRDYIKDNDFVIAVDGGYENARKLCVIPNLCVGDFDSMEAPKTGVEVIKLPKDKDDTDTLFAAREALTRGYEFISILGGTGGRFDHTFANIQVLQFIIKNGADAMLADEDNEITIIKEGEYSFPPRNDWYVSFFTLSDKTDGVTLENFKFPLENYTFTNFFPIGVSNEYRYTSAKVKIKKGSLLVVHSRKQ